MSNQYKKYCKLDQKLIILGFGSICQAVLPLIFRHIHLSPSQIIIMSDNASCAYIANDYGIHFQLTHFTPENYYTLLDTVVNENDFLLNLAVGISSKDLVQFCKHKNALYLDTSLEVWDDHTDGPTLYAKATNYMIREDVLSLPQQGPTALLTHGANPGLISHFLKQALYNMANDVKLNFKFTAQHSDWANLAYSLNIKNIQIAEYDTQVCNQAKQLNEFVNTWSVEGFIIESLQPAEIGWGTHERHWPELGKKHNTGPLCAIYLEKPAASVKVRTWTPLAGAFHGYLITHPETIALAEFLTLKDAEKLYYRPTVHYAYMPCPDAILSQHELSGRNWLKQSQQRLIVDNIMSGTDELGILLSGHQSGSYWFGSQLSIDEVGKLAPHNNATTLQVAAGVLSGMIWVINNPRAGIVEPEMLDHETILNIARPYLGVFEGHYTHWTPLDNRAKLYHDKIDETDPWQFKNILVA